MTQCNAWVSLHGFICNNLIFLYVTVAECDDDDDDDNDEDEAEAENENNCQDASGSGVAGINDSASASPHAIIDQSDDEEQDLDESKSKLPKSGLRIKLSLKPVRKSSREHKAPVSISSMKLAFFADVFYCL